MIDNNKTAIPLDQLGVEGHRYRTQSLFLENKFLSPSITPVYNLGRTDRKGTLAMRPIYMSFETEYEAAMYLLGDWEHWKTLCGNKPFMKHLSKWRDERRSREEAMAHRILLEAASAGNVPAARTLLLESKKVNKVGRPTSQQVEKAAVAQAEMDAFLVHSIGKTRGQ